MSGERLEFRGFFAGSAGAAITWGKAVTWDFFCRV